MKTLELGRKKRVLIQTALVESFCAHNIETKDIVSCYVSNNVTLLNYDANMNMVHERPQAFIEMCFSWYWWNVSPTYKGFSISYLHGRRLAMSRLKNNN